MHLSVSNTLCYIITGHLTGSLPELISSCRAYVFTAERYLKTMYCLASKMCVCLCVHECVKMHLLKHVHFVSSFFFMCAYMRMSVGVQVGF